MIYLDWSDDFLLGVDELDAHHKHMVDLLNRVYTTCMIQKSAVEFRQIVTELANYMDYHFSAEEQIMKRNGYPGLNEQIRGHEEFRQKMEGFIIGITDTEYATIDEVQLTQILAGWIKEHLTGDDIKLGAYLREKQLQ